MPLPPPSSSLKAQMVIKKSRVHALRAKSKTQANDKIRFFGSYTGCVLS